MKKNWKTYLVLAAAVLATGTILGGILAEPVWAQVRAALIKDVDNPARQPFAATTGLSNITVGFALETILTVPAGKRAVVEHVSCLNFLPTGDNFVRFELIYTSGGALTRHELVNTPHGPSFVGGIDLWAVSQPIRAYADPSTTLEVSLLRRLSGNAGYECYVSGHYVDAAL
jgi:hypothetical protein